MQTVHQAAQPAEDRPFGRFLLSSLVSSVVDLGAFAALCAVLEPLGTALSVTAATLAARAASSLVNYLINYVMVFRSGAPHGRAASRYTALTIAKTLCSAALVSAFAAAAPGAPELAAKIPVDIALFFVNYLIQKRFVY